MHPNNSWSDYIPRIPDVIKHWAYFPPVTGCIYQIVMLIKIGCLNYFSWSQVVPDSVIIVCFMVGTYICARISSFILKWLKEVSYAFIYRVAHLALVLFYFIVIFCLTSVYNSIPSDIMLLLVVWVGGAGLSSLVTKNEEQNALLMLIVGIIFSIFSAVSSPFQFDTVKIDHVNYQLQYQNDRFIFGKELDSKGNIKKESGISIFKAGEGTYAVSSKKPQLNFNNAILALNNQFKSYVGKIKVLIN